MARDSLQQFHPAVRRWFGERFAAPTAPQRGGAVGVEVERSLVRRDVPPVLREYVARSG